MRKERSLKSKFVNTRFYHVYNHGVEKRTIFLDDTDRYRFIHNLSEFNNKRPASPLVAYHVRRELRQYRNHRKNGEAGMLGSLISKTTPYPLVGIVAFALMPSSFHLLVQQKKKGGITTFLRKLGTGYTNYFNQKHTRVGHLFAGRFKSREVPRDDSLLQATCFIHLLPLSLVYPQRKKVVPTKREQKKIFTLLESYRWSSLPGYIKRDQFFSFVSKDAILTLLGKQPYKKFLLDCLARELVTLHNNTQFHS